ncbi:membrane carboxypeptidase [Piscinibacter sakaiensis]|uniref:peptidoglycan glycosyltransferase n=1 Tax=Piscinibacter sakaiensis TaxID=1547922 RepID=A0A0K8P4N4_PISS1|nr:membrane carboxypeptidase [Piscinibacter sakaiensis]
MPGSPPPRRRWRLALGLALTGVGLLAGLAALVRWEMRHSTLQSRALSAWARELGFALEAGPAPQAAYPSGGPYDTRLGYTRLPQFLERLRERQHRVTAQARQSPALAEYLARGFFSPHEEKAQTGLRVLDCRGDIVYSTGYPQRVYRDAQAIPPLLAEALSFIENRELLHPPAPTHNPAVEWDRLGRAVVDQLQAVVDSDHAAAGGSTLATQLEKFRHSPDGRTASIHDKYLQMVSASVRAYRDGPDTGGARQRILLDYVNGLPLGALRGYGEVNGVLDGLEAWYGADLDEVQRLLRLAPEAAAADPAQAAARGLAFRQVLSLFIAQRRPAHFFGSGQPQLQALTESYLRLLAQGGVIDAGLAQAALAARPQVRSTHPLADGGEAVATIADRKAAKLVRTELSALLDTPNFYDLDRLDLRAASSIDGPLQARIGELLRQLREPGEAKARGLVGRQLLETGDPAKLYYSFTLYERGEGVNRVRVQTDNLDQPFDINTGAKLELGSTAKLRTLVTYLEIVAALHQQLAGLDAKALAAVDVARKDRLTRWAVDHLRASKDRSLATMLEAAMDRRYSASPGETFYTGGGEHRFENFDRADDGKAPNLREALRDSVNLVFIRLMRDIVHHHLYREPGSAARILEDPAHPEREVLLARFADREGSQFMRGFYRKLKGKADDELLQTLAAAVQPTPLRLAVVFRALRPEAPLPAFSRFIEAQLPHSTLDREELQALYDKVAPGRFPLSDQGYLARIHPLELWVAAHLRAHPQATLAEVLEAGKPQRQEVYGWLFRTRAKAAQNRRILSLLEIDAFAEIHRAWQRLGYPFDRLVPSYATAIGSSGDRPAALAELMGVLVNDGLRLPTVQIDGLQFAAGTPWEARLQREAGTPERVMPAEVAAVARRALALVVDQGTARRLKGALDGPGGEALAIGGKTGTGDNRLNTYGARGALTGSKVINRTATFVFFLGDRHFGTITAFVPGAAAEGFRFTSALPVQIVKTMAPLLQPRLHPAPGSGCTPQPSLAAGPGPQRAPEPALPAASASLGVLPREAAGTLQPVVATQR